MNDLVHNLLAPWHHALKDRAKLKKDESMLVLGAAGGVGLAAVEIGKAMGVVI